ncbi:hypothetical protein [Saccharomonospora piscinae]|uniref:hypothetical protein n=1 Tax=Saccharomonospora piscinae TaxID=687388 RepID=UPI000464AA49|nr:hypothetical protein [Saccharomonospora piscinae]
MSDVESRLVAVRLRRALRLATLLVAAGTLYGLTLPWWLSSAPDDAGGARLGWAFLLLTIVAAVTGVLLLRARLYGGTRWVLVATVVTAAVVAGTQLPYGVAGWFALVLLLDRGRIATAFLLAYSAARLVQTVVAGQDVTGMVVLTALVLGFQLPVVAAGTILERVADQAAAARRSREDLRTAEVVAEQVHESRLSRFAQLSTTTVPLLEDLASGAADLSDGRVRARYAVEAAKLRRLFAESDETADPLRHELTACVTLAERRGVALHFAVWGDRPTPPLPVRRAMTEVVLRVTSVAVSEARVTLLGGPEHVSAGVVTQVPSELVPTIADAVQGVSLAVTQVVEGTKVWVEVTWNVPD